VAAGSALVGRLTQILAWGRDLLSTGLDRSADRGRARLIDDLRHERLSLAGLASPRACLMIDRHGDIGSCRWPASRRTGLVLIVYAEHPAIYLAVWMLLCSASSAAVRTCAAGVAKAASLYDPASATLIGAARRPITALSGEDGEQRGIDEVGAAPSGRLEQEMVHGPAHGRLPTRGARAVRGKAKRSPSCRREGLAVRPGSGGVRAFTRDLRPCRHRCGDGGGDRGAVRAFASRRAHLRVRVSRAASTRSMLRARRSQVRRSLARTRRQCHGVPSNTAWAKHAPGVTR
jgi:hypothetical protein